MIKYIQNAGMAFAILTVAPLAAYAEAPTVPMQSAGTADATGTPTKPARTKLKIASSAHRENGCSESGASFKVAIPDHERLDKSFQGILAGIEVVVREHNGTASYGNFQFLENGTAIGYTLSARGGGSRISIPFGGNVCASASGANIAIDVYAVYLPTDAAKGVESSSR